MAKHISSAFKNIRRSPYQSIAAILILTISLTITQLFALASFLSHQILTYFETKPQVTAFFTDAVSETEILALRTTLETFDYVKTASYISKQQALEYYRQLNQDEPALLEMVTADILPASLEVSATTPEGLPQIAEVLSNTPGVEEVIFQDDVIEALNKWTFGLRVAGISLVSILTMASLLITSIIISIKASGKRHEIMTMRLLGAKPGYIAAPFMLEGAIYGLISSLISWGIVMVLLLYSTPLLIGFLGEIPVLPIDWLILLGLLGTCALLAFLLGTIAGASATSRYKK